VHQAPRVPRQFSSAPLLRWFCSSLDNITVQEDKVPCR
jgi:hypothetical protein